MQLKWLLQLIGATATVVSLLQQGRRRGWI
jgi:hypothetical protein